MVTDGAAVIEHHRGTFLLGVRFPAGKAGMIKVTSTGEINMGLTNFLG
jgi:hypothetical protein